MQLESKFRVRYSETDQMGVVYHAHYLVWMEVARTDLIQELGFPYGELEKSGVFLPVIEVQCRYRKSARYGDEIRVRCQVSELKKLKVRLTYEIRREDELLAEGVTILGCIDAQGRPQKMPEDLYEAFSAESLRGFV